ncbi:MAG: dihydrolipoyl dehydrogenase [Candidatus Aceula meridiana]|nr:dihydrolipoyl dehydrogenase [Candidatus Aceula meridiana]
MSKTVQLAVIGAGPAGYTAAFLAASKGLNIALIDDSGLIGGTCLHKGCIPSKTLLQIAKTINAAKQAEKFGVTFSKPKIDIKRINAHKNDIVKKLSLGLAQLSRQRKLNFVTGTAQFLDSKNLSVEKQDGSKLFLTFEKCIIATGSTPIIPSFALEKSKNIITSEQALDLESIPKTLLIVGGGYIGLEMAQTYSSLGSKVSLWEMTGSLLPESDEDLVRPLLRTLKKEITIKLGTAVKTLTPSGKSIKACAEEKGKEITERFEKVLVAAGRKPNSRGINLQKTKIQLDEKGFIQVDSTLKTAEENIYAIGDVVAGPLLAHRASAQAHTVVKNVCGESSAFTPSAIPSVVYTSPEVAFCGLTETQAQIQNKDVEISKLSWAASGRALSLNQTQGLTKLIFNSLTKKLVGAGIVGADAGELIAECVLAVEAGLDAKTIASSIHPHPTLSETIKECAEKFLGECAHSLKN